MTFPKLSVRIPVTRVHAGPVLDKVPSPIEDGVTFALAISTVRRRVERFVGV